MKKALFPYDKGGDIWVVTHRLSLVTERHQNIRPIHVWTFLGCHAKSPPAQEAYRLFMSLENKLFGVRLARSRLRQSLSLAAEPCYSHANVQDYDAEQQVMCDMESYLNSVYSVLEITSEINRRIHKSLPRGFRSQAKKNKYPLFGFSNWSWLPLFYDLRTFFAHYASPFPDLGEKAFMLEVEEPSGLLVLKKGKQRVDFIAVLAFADHLFVLLDMWALHELQGVKPDAETWQARSRDFIGPLKGRKSTAKPFLKMARRFQELALESTQDEHLRNILTSINIKV